VEEILLIAIAAVLSGAESWNGIADYGEDKREWLQTFLTLPSGVPSHDTFNRMFSALDPEELEKGFVAWVSSIARLTAGEVVTIDAMGCQRSIAAKIVEKKADYILAVTENQGHLLEEIEDSFQMLAADAVAEEIDCGHGRVERRTGAAIADLSLLEKASEWASLQGLVRIQAERCHPPRRATGKTEREIHYCITSLRPDAERLNASIRQHWGIENKLHCVLDVGFREDLDRKRAGHAAQNFSVFNRIALNLLKQDKTSKRGVHGKRFIAGWDNDYLLPLLRN
jgi:predicted transposase YbfD/YdcC